LGCNPVVEGWPAGSSSTGQTTSTGEEPGVPTTDDVPTTGEASTSSPASTTSTGTDNTGSTTGVVDPPMCGDGVVEGEEICDDGFEANELGNACSDDCTAGVCNDGIVQAVLGEACDDGPQNVAVPAYDQCSTACVRGGFCGDGVVQAEGGEECEPSGRPDDVKNCAAMCRYSPRIAFVTSASYTGGAFGGLAGADKVCNEFAAASPELGGTYRAWLLVDGQSLADRFPEFAEPAVAWNFTNMGADLLATSFAELVALGPARPIAYTESGAPLPEQWVWTNISEAGVAGGGDCAQWTSDQGAAALVGRTGFIPDAGPDADLWHAERQWTDYDSYKFFCNNSYHIYCLQVAD